MRSMEYFVPNWVKGLLLTLRGCSEELSWRGSLDDDTLPLLGHAPDDHDEGHAQGQGQGRGRVRLLAHGSVMTIDLQRATGRWQR